MKVVGIDTSLTSTGLCTIDAGKIVSLHSAKSRGKLADTYDMRSDRLFKLANEIVDYVTDKKPNLVVIEAPSYGSNFGSAHDRSGLWWQVHIALRNDGYPLARVAPQTRAKYGTGAGNSKKDVVFAAVKHLYTDLSPRGIANDDEGDAILLAAMGSRWAGFPVEPAGSVSDRSETALDGVLWPSV